MAKWRRILQNQTTRVTTYMAEEDGNLVFKEVLSADDANYIAGQAANIRTDSADWRHVLKRSTQNHRTHIARIPALIVNELIRDGIWGNPERMTRWLNDPDNSMWRTGGGTVKVRGCRG